MNINLNRGNMDTCTTAESGPGIGDWERVRFRKMLRHALLKTAPGGGRWHFGSPGEERCGACVVLAAGPCSRSLHYPAGEVRRYLAMGYDAAVAELTEDLKALVDEAM